MVFLVLISSPSQVACAENENGGIEYEVTFEGISDEDIEKNLRFLSNTVARKGQPPPTPGLLRGRVERDIPDLVLALRSMGYYDASIESEIRDDTVPAKIIFHVRTGQVYRIRTVEIEVREDDSPMDLPLPTPSQLALTPGMPADARKILDAEESLVQKMKARGHPFATVVNTRVVVDHRTEDVSVTFPLAAGPAATFGETDIQGLATVERDYIENKIPWKKGDPYNEELLQELRKRLTETRLFSLIRTTHGTELEEDGALPMVLELTERKPRTVRAGVSYKTDEGFGATASWEHRNLWQRAERLRTSLVLSEISLALEGAFEKPDFLRQEQTLNANARLARDETDAYESQSLESFVVVRRDFGRGIKVSAGPGFRLSRVDNKTTGFEEFALVSFPGQFDWDFSNDLLDPTRGGRLRLQLTPYMNTLDTGITFLKTYVSYSHYWPIMDAPSLLFAGRAALGSMAGTSRDAMPADIRFYAGGGGSIRGYPFQSVSPLDANNIPDGGRSLIEFSTELRWKVTETIGVVTFLDGGGAFEPAYPDFSTALRYGAGAGIRYFTPIGPLRLDIGVPLNRREDIDGPVQFYISLGQAF